MEQLTRLGTDYVDYYWLHALNAAGYENAVRLGVFEEVARLKEEGKIRHLGFSFHDNAATLDRILTEHPEMEYVQLQLNYFDWNSEVVQSGECYKTAARHRAPVIVMEPAKGGALAKVPDPIETLFRQKRPDLSDASWAIRFAASLDNVMIVLSGMEVVAELRRSEKIGFSFNQLPPDAPEKTRAAERTFGRHAG